VVAESLGKYTKLSKVRNKTGFFLKTTSLEKGAMMFGALI